ncbi:recombinase family protein [Ligilactobacillus ceti]|uniref:Resolvase, N-terminal domain protein n=1 Tax=Ligilactobacillus ceti DSM 22408 TaxID=1122146 RepID=A0A0R2KHE8_9LACO|nr:recombinase family protein [Ligilactobacillus ceti]KRN88699.1 resolvase, N-terminal domain protein [Ligilactobacillus ceti DSM 22408]
MKEIIKIENTTFKIKKINKLRVAAYARVSTEKDEQKISIEAQKEYFKYFILNNPKWEFAGLFVDEGLSGTSYHKREGFNQMIDKARNGEIDRIVTKSISRFARNTVDTISIIRELKAKGISVFFQKENIDTLDAKSEFVLTLMSSFAQEESRSISENITWGHRKRFRDGKVTVPFSSFLGYSRGEKGELVVNEQEANIVRAIYYLRVIGCTINQIVKELETNNVLTPQKKEKWNHSVVLSIIRNEKYKGDALLQKKFTVDFLTRKQKVNEGELPQYYVENSHPPIVLRDTHEYANKLLETDAKSENKKTITSALSSKIVCKECGDYYGRFKIHPEWHGGRWAWRCRNKYSRTSKCKVRHIYDDELIKSISKAIMEYIKTRDDLIKEVEDISKVSINSYLTENKSFMNYVLIDRTISPIIKSIYVNKNHVADIELIDGTVIKDIVIEGTCIKVGRRLDKKYLKRIKYQDSFKKWLELRYLKNQVRNILQKVNQVNRILEIKDAKTYINELEKQDDFSKYQSEVKKDYIYAIRLYFEFLYECIQDEIEDLGLTGFEWQRINWQQTTKEVDTSIDEFKEWLNESTEYSPTTQKNIIKKVRKAHRILSIANKTNYIYQLEKTKEYQCLSNKIQSVIKYSYKVYLRFITEK